MADDMGEKTEQPTGRKLGMARTRGQIPKSLDLSGAVDLTGAVLVLMLLGGTFTGQLLAMLRTSLSGDAPGSGVDTVRIVELLRWAALQAAVIGGPFLALMAAVAAMAQFMQVGFLWTGQPLQPDLNKLNPITGMGRLFSKRNLVKTGLGLAKMAAIVWIVVWYIRHAVRELAGLPALSAVQGWTYLGGLVLEMAAWMLLVMLIIGIADWWYQRWQHTQDLKMSKQEVQDERKSSEGDEQVKAKRLKLGRQMALQRMRMDVPKADVVVTNPTHFAVALRYDPNGMDAPRVVAKGADFLAFRIREVAGLAGVPIVERPDLARALYAYVGVGQEIRPEHYEAVAELLAYVYRLNQQAA
jgi:flagellar biosynthesis protein FlhB